MIGKYVVPLLFFALSLCGCSKMNRLPASTGQPYEVVLEGDTDSIVAQILTEDVPALPQPEQMFRIIRVKRGKVTSLYQKVRNRVVVDVDRRNRGYETKVRKNVNASPQTIIYIKAQNAGQLKAKLDADKLRSLLDKAEIEHLATRIKPNAEKQKEVESLFGIEMRIPKEMDAGKRDKNFVWYSNNATSGMKNLLLFKVKKTGPEHLKQQVDSVLRRNMPGETDGMFMVIPQLGERGLWEMEGDAMGGPYVMKTIEKKREMVIVIGFVYAPEMKKRNLIKQLEAVISTIKVEKKN